MKPAALPIAAIVAILPLAGCQSVIAMAQSGSGAQIRGTGPLRKEDRRVGNFTQVEAGSAFEIDLRAGGNPRVSIEAQQSILPLIRTEVVNGTLRIRTEGSFNTDKPLRAVIVTRSLDGLNLSGAATIKASSIRSSAFRLRQSGASRADLRGDFGRLDGEVSGASQTKLSGRADSLTISASGASQFDSRAVPVRRATVTASGASHANVRVTDALIANASGASHINHSGGARVSADASGASHIGRN